MIHQRAFICGHFTSVPVESLNEKLTGPVLEGTGSSLKSKMEASQKECGLGWEKDKDSLSNFAKDSFYKNFRNFMFSSSLSRGCCVYKKRVDAEFSFRYYKSDQDRKGMPINIKVDQLNLYILPFNVVLFSIEVEQENEQVDRLCSTMRILRNCGNYQRIATQEEQQRKKKELDIQKSWKNLINSQLRKVCQLLTGNEKASFMDLVENGQRMKIFHMVWADDELLLTEAEKCALLYNLGTSDPKATVTGTETNESPSFIHDIVRKNCLSIFPEWEALSLPDSFVVLYYKLSNQERELTRWRENFRILYIYVLFLKCYLYKINNDRYNIIHDEKRKKDSKKEIIELGILSKFKNFCRVLLNNRITNSFRKLLLKIKLFVGLEETSLMELNWQMKMFETRYVYLNISYNMFPMEVYKCLYKGMQIDQERAEVYRLIESEQKEADAANTKAINTIVLMISVFTLFSAVLSACQLINNIFPFISWLPSEEFGYFLFTIIFSIFFGVIIWRFVNALFIEKNKDKHSGYYVR